MQRSDILEQAGECVNVDRMKIYGPVENSFTLIGQLWGAYLGMSVSAEDAAAMLALMKIARIKNSPTHADNWVDLAGYAACGGEIATERDKLVASEPGFEAPTALGDAEIAEYIQKLNDDPSFILKG